MISNTNFVALAAGLIFSHALYANVSNFTAIGSGLIGLDKGSTNWGDYDNDGDLDILISGIDSSNSRRSEIYRNDSGGVFTSIVAGLPGVDFSSAAWGDYDNDGDLDIILTGWTGSSSIANVYRNDGNDVFSLGAALAGVSNGSVEWGDYDNDGDLDVLLAGSRTSGKVSEIHRNDNGVFTNVNANLPGVDVSSLAWGDYDGDGDLDILLTGITQSGTRIGDVYRNDSGSFVAANAGLPQVDFSSVAWGDYDNDGDLDIALAGWTGSNVVTDVYRNDGGATFTAANVGLPGINRSAIEWGDFDNDGNLDILLTGWTGSNRITDVYLNDGNTFTASLGPFLGSNLEHCSVAAGDYDNDGDLDILFSGDTAVGKLSEVYRNDTGVSANQSPTAPTALFASNTSETTVSLAWSGALDDTTPVSSLRYRLRVGTTPGGQDVISPMSELVSGKNRLAVHSSLVGTTWILEGLTPGTTYYWSVQAIDHSLAGGSFSSESSFIQGSAHFIPIGANLSAVSLSSASWGDYDGDGDLDFVITGSAADGSPSTEIYRNNNGSFASIVTGLPDIHLGTAEWGDYDNDGDLDILLTGDTASGLITEIFINSGGIGFTSANTGLPGIKNGFSAWADYDNDGDLDILLSGTDGLSERTRIFRNDSGQLTDIDANLPGASHCSGAWGDYDNDGDLDILLTGTMGSGIYQNNNGIFSNINAGLTDIFKGGASWGDYDNDGDLDLILSGRTSSGEITEIYQNTGGVFIAISSSIPGLRNSSVVWGDYDNDGNLDILVSGATSGGAIKICEVYRNEGNNTFTSINAGITGVARSSAVWGDYNNDGKLDIFLTGTTGDGNFAEIYQNISTPTPNSPPAAPDTLATENITNDHIMLSWTAPMDDSTPSVALGYRLRVGTAPGAQDIVSPMSNLTAGKEGLAALAPINGTSWTINGLAYSTTYYWSVQAIDHTLAAGLFATEGSFTTPPPPFGAISSGLSPLSSSSVDWGDYDNDGDLDLLLTGKSGSSKSSDIYRNDNGVFIAISAGLPGLSDGSAKWGDFDNDGDLDILLTGEDSGGVISSEVYLNTGGTFAAINVGLPGVKSGSSIWGDYDNDGDLDILLNGISSTTRTTDIFRNSNGTFTRIKAGLPEAISSSTAWGDFDNDGDLDILLTGSTTSGRVSEIFRNDGGSFVAISAGLAPVDFSSAVWGDYDNDGDLDVLITGLSSSGRMSEVYRNDGGSFTSINAGLPGVDLGSSSWGDFDNDGDLDILLTGSTESGNLSDVFVNEAGIFVALNTNLAAVSLGAAAWADYDNDADLDLMLTGASGSSTDPAFSDIYRNDSVASPNAVPTAPVGISAGPTFTKSTVLNWTAPTDDTTPVDALTYRLRIGTIPEAEDILSPMSDLISGKERLASSGPINGTSWSVKNLAPLTTYYWSVQGIDHALAAGAFATEGSFTTTDYPANAVEATAYYPLDGNANDLIGGHHGAASSTDLSWQTAGTRSFASLGDDGSIALPLSLTENLLENGVMEFNFDFRITESDLGNSGIRNELIFAIKESGSSAMWQNAGLMFLAQFPVDPSDPYKLIFSLQDSFSPTGYLWKDIGTGQNLLADEWVNVRFSISTNSRAWRIEVNGVESTGNLAPDFDINAFTAAIQSNIATVGGQLGSHHPGWTVDFDFDNLTVYDSSDIKIPQLTNAYSELARDIQGLVTHTELQKQTYLNTIKELLPFVTFNQVSADLYAYTAAYEAANLPLYQDGVVLYDEELPIHGQAVLFSQEFVFRTQYSPANVENMAGVVFEHSEVIPGAVPSNTPRLTDAVANVNGTYQSDPAFRHGDDHLVLRPTGHFAAPGEVVTITVPESVVSSGLSVVVGAHIRDMVPENIGRINRFKDISAEYPMDSTQIKVVSPFGGGIYLKVANGTTAGWFDMTIDGAIKSPYFSWRAGRETDVSAWLAEVAASGAPWADFESDKYMFTIPVSALSGVSNPDAIMQRWDQILDSFRIVSGRPLERQRPEYYIPDTRLATPAYGAGYPLVITLPEFNRPQSDWNPLTVLTVPPSWILLHEMGHNAAHPTITPDASQGCDSQFEAESIVHINAVHIYNTLYGMSIDEAFAASAAQSLSLNEAAFDWILSTNFRTNQPMSFDLTAPIVDQDMLKYQHRSWAKYVDIAKHFGWSKLGEINGSFYTPGVPRVGTVCDSHPVFTDPDEYIRAASDVLGVNAAPLFHFWGIIPSPSLATELAIRPKSQTIKAMIETYLEEVIPLDLASYTVTHDAIYPRMGNQQPRYDQYITQFDETFVDEMFAQFQLILQTYGLVGPASPTSLQAEVSGNSVTLNWTDNSSDEVGFIISAINPTETTYQTVATVTTNVTSYTMSNLTPGTYRFRVTALNLEGLESYLYAEAPALVAVLTLYQGWIEGYFPGEVDPSIIGESADPDNDGISNLLSFIFGGDPTVSDLAILPTMTVDATNLIFESRRSDQSISIATYIEMSTDLKNWIQVIHGIDGVSITIDDDEAGQGVDKVTVTVPLNGEESMFIRHRY